VCGTVARIEPSQPAGDAPFPSCGALLWFVQTTAGLQLYDAEDVKPVFERLVEALAECGIDEDQLTTGQIDPLDVTELVMLIEDQTGLQIPDEDAQQLQSPGDALDYLLNRLL
jgi:acyl carrier protein